MSFLLDLSQLSENNVIFSYSAAETCMMALHVLQDPGHHPLHMDWVLRARKAMNKALKDEINAYSFFYARPVATFWNPAHSPNETPDFLGDVESFVRAPIEAYVDEALRVLTRGEMAWSDFRDNADSGEGILTEARHRYPQSDAVIQELLVNPETSKKRFADLLVTFWNLCLADEWENIEDLLVSDIAARGRSMVQHGVTSAFQHLAPEIHANLTNASVKIRRLSKADIHFRAEDCLYLVPSYFSWPHVMVKMDKPVTIVYPVTEMQTQGRQPAPPADVLQNLRAVGDLTRLQIIQILSTKPRSTREIAALLGLTEAAISKHLHQLQEAKMVTSYRESYYVFYKLVTDPFRNLKQGLDGLLGH